MDPLSISLSIVGLLQLTSNIISFLGSVKDASSEQTKLRNEVPTVAGLLEGLELRLKVMAANDEGLLTVRALAVKGGAFDQFAESLNKLRGKTDCENVSRIEKFGRNLTWHIGKIEVNKTLMSVERLKSLLNLALMTDLGVLMQTIEVNSKDLTREVAEINDGLKRQMIDKECQLVGDWLSPFDFNTIQQEIFKKCHKGTGKWMLESDGFQQWLSTHNGTLWCPGIPGAGKTYLASIVIDYLQRQTSSEGLNPVLCLFCNFNSQANQTACKFMGALLKQLARASRPLPKGIKDIYDKRENDHQSDFKVLADAFRTELEKYPKTFIVIDALDEVSESADIRTVLLEELRSCRVNLLVTSRHDPTIRRQFSEAQHYEIHATDEDIRSYVSDRMAPETCLSRLIRRVPSLEDGIPALIIGSAKGMFLHARFHMDEISNKTKPKDIQEALEKPPQGLNDTYNRTINRIRSQGSESWNLARKVLLWLSNALKPLSLGELQEAVAIETGMTSISERDLDDTESLISACAGLVVLEGEKEAAAPRLVHYTLQEFLNKNQDLLFPNPHAEVARACLALLSFDAFNNKPPEIWHWRNHYGYKIPRDMTFPNPYHFTFYAALSWGFHAQKAGETEQVMDAAIDFVSRPANVAYNWLFINTAETRKGPWGEYNEQIVYEDLWKDVDLFRLLLPVHFGLEGVLVKLLKRYIKPAESTLDTVISRLTSHAARRGYREIVRLLLTQKDVDWDRYNMGGEDLSLQLDDDALPRFWRMSYWLIYAATAEGSTLDAAVTHTKPSQVRMLLEAWCRCGKSRPGDNSWREMMDLMLEYKPDIDAHSPQHGTLLHLAARTPIFGYGVEYLLLKGANPNLPDGLGKTPLDVVQKCAKERWVSEQHTCVSDSGYDNERVIQILRTACGKTAREMSPPSVGEQGPSFPPEWLERLKYIQELNSPQNPTSFRFYGQAICLEHPPKARLRYASPHARQFRACWDDFKKDKFFSGLVRDGYGETQEEVKIKAMKQLGWLE